MKSAMKKTAKLWGLVMITALLTLGGCARVGQDFKEHRVEQIKIGQTTQSDIINMFGQPWRKGIENGVTMWTYGRYTYRLIGETDTKDLIIKFDKDAKVKSYTFNETVD
ncbi:MAG: outer membrane protein assembly factor BamE [Sulfurimonas sp.]|uniref:outer membrane protein assembly factor BamE domain-containing protein n=1 Tax=Sulfurimonas sp. TaxID=2022749 RepID=UPI002632BBDC|nr:outer membrane protein assembly factor BamE [Sulfurimonas sp.]MCW8895449.1 outer membrane protein assembly factor BamE [Sulfurimonas sp.]MCW8953833.1 outer membrane protein assembly factor BamE [Sulfurimonas sp.]MCW9067396.1 outer membrane protein assembly factor BamE [Sulfurimonas sp.]